MRLVSKLVIGCISVAAVALGFNAQNLREGARQKTAAEAAFDRYGQALEAGDYQAAYDSGTTEFKSALSLAQFTESQKKLISDYGPLLRVARKDIFVHGRGSPMYWTAVVEEHQTYRNKDLKMVCELHLEHEQWKLVWVQTVRPIWSSVRAADARY